MIQVGASHVNPFPRGNSTINVLSLNKKIIKIRFKVKGMKKEIFNLVGRVKFNGIPNLMHCKNATIILLTSVTLNI